MKFLERIKIPLAILVVGFIAFFVYRNYFVAPAVSDLTQQNVGTLGDTSVDEQTATFLDTLSKLNTIAFNTKVFDSEQFHELQDNTVRALENRDISLRANPAGKANPFAPISGMTSLELNGGATKGTSR